MDDVKYMGKPLVLEEFGKAVGVLLNPSLYCRSRISFCEGIQACCGPEQIEYTMQNLLFSSKLGRAQHSNVHKAQLGLMNVYSTHL